MAVGITQTANPDGVNSSGNVATRIVEHAITILVLMFNPSNDWIIHT
jgi:hypothetical protein